MVKKPLIAKMMKEGEPRRLGSRRALRVWKQLLTGKYEKIYFIEIASPSSWLRGGFTFLRETNLTEVDLRLVFFGGRVGARAVTNWNTKIIKERNFKDHAVSCREQTNGKHSKILPVEFVRVRGSPPKHDLNTCMTKRLLTSTENRKTTYQSESSPCEPSWREIQSKRRQL